MNEILTRLSTFLDWTAPISCFKLAGSGFIYTGVGDRVRCYLCGLELDGWQEGDDPIVRHQQEKQNCSVALGTDYLNDTAADTAVHVHQSPLSADDDGAVLPDRRAPSSNSRQFHTFWARMATFKDWSKYGIVRPVDLARVGLYFTGVQDVVKCAFCRIECKDWNSGDLPAVEHQRLAPHCPFVGANYCLAYATVRLPCWRSSYSSFDQFRYVVLSCITSGKGHIEPHFLAVRN